MAKKPFTVRTMLDFVSAALCGGCSFDEAVAAIERDGYKMDAPLPKKPR